MVPKGAKDVKKTEIKHQQNVCWLFHEYLPILMHRNIEEGMKEAQPFLAGCIQ
jgi:hypothetical protein